MVESEITSLIVKHDYKGKRIDKYLVSRFQELDLSRTYFQGLINNGNVTVCERLIKTSYEIKKDDIITIKFSQLPSNDIEPENIPLDIIYEDEHLMVINKTANIIVHPARGNASGTLVNAVKYHCDSLSQLNGELRPGIVHRLDKNTTGAIIIVKTDRVHGLLGKQFENREVKKMYIAVVDGNVAFDSDIIHAPIGRHHRTREKMTIRYDNGKPGVSKYEVAERFKKHTLVNVFPKTGRTHQIRVHMKYIGHPIVADALYNDNNVPVFKNGKADNTEASKPLIERQALHAFKVGFTHPVSNKFVEFEAPLPDDMNNLINGLRENNNS